MARFDGGGTDALIPSSSAYSSGLMRINQIADATKQARPARQRPIQGMRDRLATA